MLRHTAETGQWKKRVVGRNLKAGRRTTESKREEEKRKLYREI